MSKKFNIVICLICFCFTVCLLFAIQPAFAKKRSEIVIGTHLSLSGVQAAVVIHQKWAYELAVKQINDKGGIYVKEYDQKLPVKLVIRDDESDPNKAAA